MECSATGCCRTLQLRLRGLGFETHDNVFSQGILSPDFEHGKELVEMALGEFGIDGKPEFECAPLREKRFFASVGLWPSSRQAYGFLVDMYLTALVY